ncbi:putative 3-phenylpropionic acid transporter [Rubellimicrobium mesophilum DSM 19309]|uniref:Putative 3-phenylpropionic acid transporter n=1 Tax=Rubellimicrobium mesophilum DSM 19309 TaxID=442562 RepID=A0A017HS41_9RHOB|nr:MFS transporter [Rubellimicrobium mesophilum]EYD77327.1 putative 3-phenylpropionic acid transporter [Rubellimicrobium mesophilum DSM 19309]
MTASAAPLPRALSPEARTAVYYSTLFMGAALSNVYAGLWMAGKGLSPDEIGAVNAVPLAVMLVLNWLVGRLADRASDWRGVIVGGALLAALFPLGFFAADGFWGILLVWTLAGLPHMATVPVLDAAAMRMTARRGTAFGALRAWGTAGYLAVLLVAGWVMERLGPAGFAPLMVGLAAVRAVAALGLPRFRAPEGETEARGARHLREVMRPWFLLPLLGGAAVMATHLVLNAFQGLLWQAQGFGLGTISLLIALGAASEMLVFFAFGRIFGRFRARTLMLASAGLTALRWAMMAQAPGLPMAILLQASHGLTFAMGFLAAVQFIANWTSEEIAAEAQGFFVVLQQALSVATMSGFGLLMAHWGVGAHWGSAAVAGLGALAIWASWRLQGP